MPKQRMMKTSMTGPRLRAEIDALLPLSIDERAAKMKKMPKFKLALIADVIIRLNKKEFGIEEVRQVLLWEMPNGEYYIEIQGKHF